MPDADAEADENDEGGDPDRGPFKTGMSDEEYLLKRAEAGIENYDIRTDKSKAEDLLNFRLSVGKNAAEIADVREGFVAGENTLRERVPTLKVEYNEDIRIPEVIAPDVDKGRAFLTGASRAKRSGNLRRFISENASLIGLNGDQAGQLKVSADYTNPDGNLSYAVLDQSVNGVPVFRGEIKAGFTRQGRDVPGDQ